MELVQISLRIEKIAIFYQFSCIFLFLFKILPSWYWIHSPASILPLFPLIIQYLSVWLDPYSEYVSGSSKVINTDLIWTRIQTTDVVFVTLTLVLLSTP